MGCYLRGKVYLGVAALFVKVYNDTGWVSDSVGEMGRGHFVRRNAERISDQPRAVVDGTIKGLAVTGPGSVRAVFTTRTKGRFLVPSSLRLFIGICDAFRWRVLRRALLSDVLPDADDIHPFSIDSSPSTIMTYYTEKARKKHARKQRTAGTHSKG